MFSFPPRPRGDGSRSLTTVVEEHRAPTAGAGRVLGDLLRDSSAILCPLFILRTLSDVEGAPHILHFSLFTFYSPLGLPPVLRFARFRVMSISLALIGLSVRRETAQTAKGWPSFRASLSRSRSCGYLRQSTKRACSLDQPPKAKRRRRATLGGNCKPCTVAASATSAGQRVGCYHASRDGTVEGFAIVSLTRGRVSAAFRFWRLIKGPYVLR